ncbi:vasodilator-stimulated phosphoprotein-like [Pongo pygmaeus]|uniref:vasodilator-stimulated phosphoprotein-like n=1 Tax=Pongo pygmaeus TaxID=9600 RepID=UPI0023E3114D|nr:vasodilator-stimulated phosphoprotein-like [Pongo pygmaeus]
MRPAPPLGGAQSPPGPPRPQHAEPRQPSPARPLNWHPPALPPRQQHTGVASPGEAARERGAGARRGSAWASSGPAEVGTQVGRGETERRPRGEERAKLTLMIIMAVFIPVGILHKPYGAVHVVHN